MGLIRMDVALREKKTMNNRELYRYIGEDGMRLGELPVEERTGILCKLACEQNGNAIRYVPEDKITRSMAWSAVRKEGNNLCYVPKKYREYLLCYAALRNVTPYLGHDTLSYVPRSFAGYPETYVTEEERNALYIVAVQTDGLALKYVPEEYKTRKLCKLAFGQNVCALKYIPEKWITYGMCRYAVSRKSELLSMVPEVFRTVQMCRIALTGVLPEREFMVRDALPENLYGIADLLKARRFALTV